VGALVAASGFLPSVVTDVGRHAHGEQGQGPDSKVLDQKTSVNHVHRRGWSI